jgi:hypothetical protein
VDERGREAAPAALVGDGRIGVAVGEDDVAGRERGADELADVLRAVGGVEQQLSERIDLLVRVQEGGAQALAEPRPARLARHDHI